MKRKLLFLTLLSMALPAFSAEYFVDASRPDDTGAATNWATAKKTIQAAVDLTVNGDTVWVTNGTYLLSAEISVTNAITVQSVNDPEVTIVDGCGSNRCFNLSGACLVSGFTITNGYASGEYPYWFGGGIYCENSMPVVSNCVVVGNGVGGNEFGISDGGGMYNGIAADCIFRGNTAYSGGGMGGGMASNCTFVGNVAEGAGPLFNNPGFFGGGGMSYGAAYHCTFTSNSANWSGGGMEGGFAYNCLFEKNHASVSGGGASLVSVYGCLFLENSTYIGGGLHGGNAYNCTFVQNSAGNGGGLVGADWDDESTAVQNCIFVNNTATEQSEYNDFSYVTPFHSCSTQLTYGINGNITNAPLFVDAANGNFKLMSNSPCINWGNNSYVTNSTDLDGNPRIVEGTVDMGAYEYQGTVGLADSDNDGINDDWERAHGGNQRPDATCSNGVNSILQAYVAGLDPNDPDNKFSFSVETGTYFGNILRWQSVPGREYAVYYSTNLVSGFMPLIQHLVTGSGTYIDDVYESDGPRYYKIDVQIDDNPADNVTPPSPLL